METAEKVSAVSFEQALVQLEETVQALEAGGLPLEEAITLFERGMRLAKLCNDLLDQADLRVIQLQHAVSADME